MSLVYYPLCGCGFRNIGGIIFCHAEDFILNTLFACVAVVDYDTVDGVADFLFDCACVLCQVVAPFLEIDLFFCGALAMRILVVLVFENLQKTLLNKKLPMRMLDKHWVIVMKKGIIKATSPNVGGGSWYL